MEPQGKALAVCSEFSGEEVSLCAGVWLLCAAPAAVLEPQSIAALQKKQFCFAGTKTSSIPTQQEVYKTVISCPVSALASLLLLLAGCQWVFYCFGCFLLIETE